MLEAARCKRIANVGQLHQMNVNRLYGKGLRLLSTAWLRTIGEVGNGLSHAWCWSLATLMWRGGSRITWLAERLAFSTVTQIVRTTSLSTNGIREGPPPGDPEPAAGG